jgi:acetyltransferase-like isoleucine patch superfamily enzyme
MVDAIGPKYDGRILIGIGNVYDRKKLYVRYSNIVDWIPSGDKVIWPMSFGLQRMRGTIVSQDAEFGVNVLVNTGAQIDHDCDIDDHCVIAPGAILCGGVELGAECFIGAGAIIVEGVKLDPGTFIPAGSLVVKQDDIRRPQRVVQDGKDSPESR